MDPLETIYTSFGYSHYDIFMTFLFDYQAKAKVRKAEKALTKVQEFLEPTDLPTDLETITDEERAMFRQIGLKMKGALLLGKMDAFPLST